MRLDVDLPDDRRHQYCWGCRAETVTPAHGAPGFTCTTCGRRYDRSLVIDPALTWWTDASGEYWHESAGVFVRRPDGHHLFFERLFYPFQWTVPAGHIDTGEDPRRAAQRELHEEVGLHSALTDLTELGVDDIPGDSCWRGSDAHRWHTYLLDVPSSTTVEVLEEGHRPTWLPLATALEQPLTTPVRILINRYLTPR
ncbi:NUDIX hydrolase [Actinomadura macra]|uniref:NUDIX hydrolase n=1 Tax=Actinomadura macra TaxID=46164 RepID=UPI0008301556|nr:NUDIX hydrolase [Actinomadura macra]